MYGVTVRKTPKVVSAFIAAAEEFGGRLFEDVKAFCTVLGKHPAMQMILTGLGFNEAQLAGALDHGASTPTARQRRRSGPVLGL